jgi:hypothetical protein
MERKFYIMRLQPLDRPSSVVGRDCALIYCRFVGGRTRYDRCCYNL